MKIIYKFDEQGGFFAKNEDMNVVEYAYPSSAFAESAKRVPLQVSLEMLTRIEPRIEFYQAQPWWKPRMDALLHAMGAA